MLCPKCGAKVAEGDNFCEDCGASLKKADNKAVTCSRYEGNPQSAILAVDSYLAMACNIGKRHPSNEDSGTVMRCNDGSCILVVSDGVSSAVNAVSASFKAVTRVKEILSESSGNDMNLIKTAINEANDIIKALPYEIREDGIYGPEATIVAAKVTESVASIGWVGDSRAYIIGKSKQKLLTTDDSWIELVVAAGEMSRSEAAMDKRAHYVTQVLGMHDQPLEIHTLQHSLEEGCMLLLCSDGLWNYFQDDNGLLKAIEDFGMEKEAAVICEHLVNIANNEGGHDNITVAILKNNLI